jgi:hypothetical protein
MNMKNMHFDPTSTTPEVKFSTDGRLMIEGRSLPENVVEFYNPLIAWASMLKAEVVKFDLNLEYLNSASSKKLLEVLRSLDVNKSIKELIINWHYESDDEDSLESGQIFEDLLTKAVFRYHEYSEAA